jgi:hypothetical protein
MIKIFHREHRPEKRTPSRRRCPCGSGAGGTKSAKIHWEGEVKPFAVYKKLRSFASSRFNPHNYSFVINRTWLS